MLSTEGGANKHIKEKWVSEFDTPALDCVKRFEKIVSG